ncbi:PTS sugar transporter subunit IIC [Listeria booriae]|uniref:PTS sugar transporter subunit IIC n=1 Tax=Listeria booriae TaxID=1552123 RepID=UPI001628DBCA|nr:PTS transporter subunit EIIC [Listeria booriae]MBC2256838.1 PTS sugar transporter subunit IIC [Listeria booriae]MBC2305532.1 PTS sugar transporter subunit IIC [Listeria booriae]
MKRFMSWLSDVFAPKMRKITGRPWIAAVSSAMQKLIPFILTGSLIFFYNVFRSYIPALPDLGKIADYSFGLIGLITAFMMTNQAMEKLKHPGYTINASIVSICVFMMFIRPEFLDGSMTFEFGRLGPTGILVGMITGLFVAIVFNLYAKLKFLKNSSIPDFVVEWIHNILPTLVCLGIGAAVVFYANIDIFSFIIWLFSPLQSFGQTLPGFILICFIPAFFYSMGISSWLFGAVTTPIFLSGIAANIDAVNAGLPATNIVTSETVFTAALITMGGMGATLGLNVLMLFSKSRDLRTIGRICIAPSLFNINEPVMFSGPVVMNPMLMLPMWINSITGPIIIWIVMRTGLLNIPSQLIQVGQIPAPFSSVMVTGDWRAVIVYILLFAMYFVTWYPFFKVYERERMMTEEAKVAEQQVTV